MATDILRVANCSGFFGDRIGAAREMIDAGPIDVLTGDWLAELTMSVLVKQRERDPDRGYAATFVSQMEDVLADCLNRGIRIVSNAGGLNPRACALAVEEVAARTGHAVRVACVEGDDARYVFESQREAGWDAAHLDTGEPLGSLGAGVEAANAYLGCWGIAEALDAGADVVVTGRVSDASVVAGPAAWKFGWHPEDWDALAGAIVAGHVIECGAQATGGNFSFFTELDDLRWPGFPIAEIEADGSSVITKHPGTGGAVTVETVTAQLLYEIDGPRYQNPDVVARFDTIRLTEDGQDRVRIDGARGEGAPSMYKVGAVCRAGWQSSVTFVLTGLEIEAKAESAQDALWAAVPGGREAFDEVEVRLLRADREDPPTMTRAVALLTVSVAGRDREAADALSAAAVATGLAGYPGLYLTGPPARAKAYSVFWPTLLPRELFPQRVVVDGQTLAVPDPDTRVGIASPSSEPTLPPLSGRTERPTSRAPLGRVVGTRSGDKAGNATLGVWARDDAGFAWLSEWLTDERLRSLVPEAEALEIRPWWLPNLRAVGFTIVGLLGRGVAANLALDGQAKGLGEYLRAKWVDIPDGLATTVPE
jgi:hypothetical protein